MFESQDGLCGNFNCNQQDDSMQALILRGMADPIPEEQSHFRKTPSPPKWVLRQRGQAPSLESCDPEVRRRAENDCGTLPEEKRDECIIAACTAVAMATRAGDVQYKP